MLRSYQGIAPRIHDSCYIDESAQIIGDVEIGENCIIAAGTVIPEGTVIEPYSLWMGVPGKFKKKIDDEETQKTILMYGKNYFDYTQIYRKEFRSSRGRT